MPQSPASLLNDVVAISKEAGQAILEIYREPYEIHEKTDGSPVTTADQNAHNMIEARLQSLTPDIPILSEESSSTDIATRQSWDVFWLVDPLDGTKEFIKRNGEFTVNIALVESGNPIMGVIYVPVKKTLYFGAEALGAFKTTDVTSTDESLEELTGRSVKLPAGANDRNYTVVGSRSHMSPETEQFIEEVRSTHGEVDIVSMGSSLKICLVAEGAADVYPRFAPTMEWDTAAGQGIVQAAGKRLLDHSTGEDMRYNKENLLNNWFIVR